jgi:hypothetical protein
VNAKQLAQPAFQVGPNRCKSDHGYLFDIAKHAYVDHKTLEEFCRATGLPMVRTIWRGAFRFTLPELVAVASAQDYAPGQPAEGIVIRPVEETRSRILESGRLSAKVISERYALKHGE